MIASLCIPKGFSFRGDETYGKLGSSSEGLPVAGGDEGGPVVGMVVFGVLEEGALGLEEGIAAAYAI
jgi:hypothetical protein